MKLGGCGGDLIRGRFFLIGVLSLFSPSAFGGISGTVVRDDGQPAAGARVAAFALESSEQQRGRWLSADPTRNALAPVARELGPLMSQSADVSMSAGTVMTGRVVADAPVAKAIIEVDNLPLATTGADGTFAIEHVPAGARKLVARTDDRIAARQLGRERDLVLRLSKAVTVAGSVRDLQSGAPGSGVRVTAAP